MVAQVAGMPPRPGKSTCPWGGEEVQPAPPSQPRNASHGRNAPKRDSPWATDADSQASQPRNRRSHSSRPVQDTSPWSGFPNDDNDAQQRGGKGGARQRQSGSEGPASRAAPAQPPRMPVAPDMTIMPDQEEADAAERKDIMRQCISAGMDNEQITEILQELEMKKLQERQRPPNTGSSIGARPQHLPKPTMPSVAASRQARASSRGRVSYGPTDEDVAGIINQHTPPASEVSLADRRAKAKEMKGSAIGSHDEAGSRAAYMQSQQDAATARNRNRSGQGVFG